MPFLIRLKLNHGNFRIEIPETNKNTSHQPISKELIERKAYQLWDRRGRPQSSPQQQQVFMWLCSLHLTIVLYSLAFGYKTCHTVDFQLLMVFGTYITDKVCFLFVNTFGLSPCPLTFTCIHHFTCEAKGSLAIFLIRHFCLLRIMLGLAMHESVILLTLIYAWISFPATNHTMNCNLEWRESLWASYYLSEILVI